MMKRGSSQQHDERGAHDHYAGMARRGPDNEPSLQDRTLELSDRPLAERLRQSALLKVTELRSGLEIRSFSHVGWIRLGNIDVRIVPKVQQPTLLNLLRYAFGFRKLRLFDDVPQLLETAGFEDLLVYQLNAEAAELIARGLHRNYQLQYADLSSPRGGIDVPRLVRQGGVMTAQLPCRFFPRVEDCASTAYCWPGCNWRPPSPTITICGASRGVWPRRSTDRCPACDWMQLRWLGCASG